MTRLCTHPGAAFRAQPRAHAQRGALVGGGAGAGGQSQPAGADLQAAGRPVWTCAGLQRPGERLWQTALGAAWSGPGHTRSPSGESSSVQHVHCRLYMCEDAFSWSLWSNICRHPSVRLQQNRSHQVARWRFLFQEIFSFVLHFDWNTF